MLLYFIISTLSLKPIFLISGFGLSPIYGTVTQPDLYPECPPNLNKLLIRTASSQNDNFIKNYADCVAKLLQVQINSSTGKVEQLPGMITDSSPIGETSPLSSTYQNIILQAKNIGYIDNENIFSVGYNYYLHPITSNSVYDKLKLKIEEVYHKYQEKSILVSFDQGSSFLSLFISNYSTKNWAQKYVDSTIFLSPSFAGFPYFQQLYEQQLSPYTTTDELKKSIMRMPGLHIMMPNYVVFENFTVIYNLKKDFDQHNATYSFEFLKSQGKVDDEAEKIFKANVEKILKEPIPEPPVPSLLIYNDNIKTGVSYSIYHHQNITKSLIYSDQGDGTVTAEGARYACGHWKSVKCLNLRDTTNHEKILSNSRTIQTLFDFIQSDNKVIENKIGLFLVSGFVGSPLYGTVTDPNRATMCPSNMNNFLFHSSFVSNIHQLIDTNTNYWMSNDCIAMLTRVELSKDESFVTFAPGIQVKSSKFGDYDLILSYTSILERAFVEGLTHYRDLFGVGYNYMLHPLMTNEIYEELKINIEKHFNETGKKSVLGGHSQGSSFVEIFITDYVSPEWAKKYMLGVIFYAPAFAGWGSYQRSITGNYGGGFPDTNNEMKISTMRMPGLHIMMPNEGVFGNKTVIKDFPNKGDESNATFVAPLLKKLGKMDETAYKIFKLTDKYRKKPLPEPPIPSLVIYNNGAATNNGYIYNEATNSVKDFKGFGDKTVSDDGPVYACSHWKNVSCFNFKSLYIDHLGVQNQLVTCDLTFNFIERLQNPNLFPADKTILNEGVKDVYLNSSYIETYRIPNNQFNYSANDGIAAHPLSYAFDNNPKTYYLSSVSNKPSYHNNITLEFNDIVTIEAFLYDTCYQSGKDTRNFQGFPTILNVYSSIGNEKLELNAVFEGIPMYPSTRIQFVFKKPVTCDKLILEFVEVLAQKLSGYSRSPTISNLIFIRYSNNEVLPIKNAEINDDDLNSSLISEFEIFADDGFENYDLSNLFDGDENSFWISSSSNSVLYHNFITINFNKKVSLESFLYDSKSETTDSTSTFFGFPTMLNVYASENDEKVSFKTTFVGNPVYPMKKIQFSFPNNLVCKKLKLEFVKVTSQKITGSGQNPVCSGLSFIGQIIPEATKTVIFSEEITPTNSNSNLNSIPNSNSDPNSIPITVSYSNSITSSIEHTPIKSTVENNNNQSDLNDRSPQREKWNVMIVAYVVIPVFIVVVIIFIIFKIKERRQVSNMYQISN